ncbi:FHA domain-containing protein [Clavibacter sp. VKM Ac-2872]|uniref:RDD family protein n=1 Tax=Clavibacter sp. VKM Ac-2872 TaxID=2783812 RepID=UPI00188C3F31|nr:FHA domain-containing protein [Clavibacter sp. VKM Ac-2872]MBF4624007.1 RDD family protein [Clavibacter sp. VKM Ac-2872]
MLAGVVPASAGRRYTALILDAAPLLLLAAAAAAAAATAGGHWPTGALALTPMVAVAFVVANAVASLRTGQTLGRRILGLRTVDDLSGAPLTAMDRLGRLPRGLRLRTTVTADLRAGRDPLSVARAPVDVLGDDRDPTDGATRGEDDPVRRARRRGVAAATPDERIRSTAAALVLDSGESILVATPVVVGRKPEAQVDGVVHDVHPWADLSRTVARTHALFAWSGSSMWITDLGSPSGTAIITPDGERRPLVARVPTAASIGWTVELGRRRLVIEPESAPATDAVGAPGGAEAPTTSPTTNERTALRAD